MAVGAARFLLDSHMKRRLNSEIVVSLGDIGRGCVAKRTRRALSLSFLERALSTNLLQLVLLHLDHRDERALAQTCRCLLERVRHIWMHTKRWVLRNRTQLKLQWLQEARCVELASAKWYSYNYIPPCVKELILGGRGYLTCRTLPLSVTSIEVNGNFYFTANMIDKLHNSNVERLDFNGALPVFTTMRYPDTIQRMRIGASYYSANGSMLPLFLKELEFGDYFLLQKYNLDNLPRHLERLTLGNSFIGELFGLPASLKYLSLRVTHLQNVGVLPNTLEHLVLRNNCFARDFSFDNLPRGIQRVSIKRKHFEEASRVEWLRERLILF